MVILLRKNIKTKGLDDFVVKQPKKAMVKILFKELSSNQCVLFPNNCWLTQTYGWRDTDNNPGTFEYRK